MFIDFLVYLFWSNFLYFYFMSLKNSYPISNKLGTMIEVVYFFYLRTVASINSSDRLKSWWF